MVDLTLTSVDVNDLLAQCKAAGSTDAEKDIYVTVRVGESQKLGRLSSERLYKFAAGKSGLGRFAKIEVLQRVATGTIDLAKEGVLDEVQKMSMDLTSGTGNVKFDNIAREWRCKWTGPPETHKSLAEVQKALDDAMPKIAAQKGTRTQRVVCGTCNDFKVVTTCKEDNFKTWEENKFAPEEEFLAAIKAISGVSAVETQTYTIMPVKFTPPPPLKKPKVWQIGRLNPNSKSFNLEAKILDEPKEVETKGAAKISEVTIGDKSGKMLVSLKGDQASAVKKDGVYMFRNAKVQMVKGHIRLVVDQWGKIESSDGTVEEVGDKDVSAQEFELVKS